MPLVRSSARRPSALAWGVKEWVITYSPSRYFKPFKMPGQVQNGPKVAMPLGSAQDKITAVRAKSVFGGGQVVVGRGS